MPVSLRPWSDGDAGLLRRLVGDPAMMTHLGGPESEEQIGDRQARYVALASGCYAIVTDTGAAAGWVGFWERPWAGATIYEIGWSVAPEHQGCGLAVAGARAAVARARERGGARELHAFPAVSNDASNAVCARLDMALLGTFAGEYPEGNPMRFNDWSRAI